MTTPSYGDDYQHNDPGSGLPGYQPGEPQFSANNPGVALVEGNGKSRGFASLRNAFTQFARSAGSWILFTFVTVTALVVVSAIYSGIIMYSQRDALQAGQVVGKPDPLLAVGFQIIYIVMSAIIMIYGYNGGLQASEGRKLTFGKFFVLKHGFGGAFIAAFITALIGSIPSIISDFMPASEISASTIDRATLNVSATLMTQGNIALTIGMVILLFLYPFLMFVPMYAIDRGSSLGEAFAGAISDGARNYFPILGMLILLSIIVSISMIPLGLGLLATMPISLITIAIMYRSMSRGLHIYLDD